MLAMNLTEEDYLHTDLNKLRDLVLEFGLQAAGTSGSVQHILERLGRIEATIDKLSDNISDLNSHVERRNLTKKFWWSVGAGIMAFGAAADGLMHLFNYVMKIYLGV